MFQGGRLGLVLFFEDVNGHLDGSDNPPEQKSGEMRPCPEDVNGDSETQKTATWKQLRTDRALQ